MNGLALAVLLLGLTPPLHPARDPVRMEGGALRLDFDGRLWTRIVATFEGRETPLGPYRASEYLNVAGKDVTDFAYVRDEERPIEDALGRGRRLTIVGRAEAEGLEKTVTVDVRDDFPRLALVSARYRNVGPTELKVGGWTSGAHALSAAGPAAKPPFWSFQSGSYPSRPDWVLPLKKGFAQENFLGMNGTDYGGGTPVVDVWRRDAGIAVGHAELVPKLVSLAGGDADADARRRSRCARSGSGRSPPGEALRHAADVRGRPSGRPLPAARRTTARSWPARASSCPGAPASAYEPIWCAWGYGRDFTPDQVVGTLPVAKRLGFRWATLDDGWQVAEGDWVPVPGKFPNGDADMKALVDRIHEQGLKAQLWWAPLAVDPGTRLHREHPDQLLLDAQGAPRKITLVGLVLPVPGLSAGARGRRGLRAEGASANGASTASRSTAST